MTQRYTYYGEVTDGKLKIHRAKEFQAVIKEFEGRKVEVTIQRKRKHRSLLQNSYYHGVVIPIVQLGLNDVGYKMDKEQVHDYLKSQFARAEIANEQTGEIMTIQGSTARMTTCEMMDYFAEITRWAAEFLGVQIPEPNEQMTII